MSQLEWIRKRSKTVSIDFFPIYIHTFLRIIAIECVSILQQLANIMVTSIKMDVQVESEEELKQRIENAYSKANPLAESPNVFIQDAIISSLNGAVEVILRIYSTNIDNYKRFVEKQFKKYTLSVVEVELSSKISIKEMEEFAKFFEHYKSNEESDIKTRITEVFNTANLSSVELNYGNYPSSPFPNHYHL